MPRIFNHDDTYGIEESYGEGGSTRRPFEISRSDTAILSRVPYQCPSDPITLPPLASPACSVHISVNYEIYANNEHLNTSRERIPATSDHDQGLCRRPPFGQRVTRHSMTGETDFHSFENPPPYKDYGGNDHHDTAHRLLVPKPNGSSRAETRPTHTEKASLLQTEPIFGGRFSDVYQGEWEGKKVAIKRLRIFHKDNARRDVYQRIVNETLKWQNLDHPHVLPFLGVETEIFAPLICLVSPWMQRGPLRGVVFTNLDAKKYLYEVAQGLAYLHSMKIIHGDLRGGNILIDDKGHACLADFGLSVIADAISAQGSNSYGSPRWMAPELLDPDSFELEFLRTYAADVYSFACVCIEVYTSQPPFPDEANDYKVMLRVLEGERPARPSEKMTMSNCMWALVGRCWTQRPCERPNMSIVVQVLEGGV